MKGEKYYQLLEKTLALSVKKKDQALQDADNSLISERRAFLKSSLDYVEKLTELEEKKKFEFVEAILRYTVSQRTFYHIAYEHFKGMESYVNDLTSKLQDSRDTFNTQKEKIAELVKKMEERAEKPEAEAEAAAAAPETAGYLFIQDAKKGLLGYSWTRHFCCYTKATKLFKTYTFIPGKDV